MKVTLDKARHVYVLEDGREVLRSVTGVIAKAGLYGFEGIPDPKYHMQLGTNRHSLVEYYEDGSLDTDSLDDVMKRYLDSYLKLRKYMPWQVRLAEHPLYHPKFDYAGTLDIFTTEGSLIDIKGPSNSAAYRLQLGALWGLLEANGIKCLSAGTIHLQKDGSIAKCNNFLKGRQLKEAFHAFITILKENENE